jgi:hypothetical protein
MALAPAGVGLPKKNAAGLFGRIPFQSLTASGFALRSFFPDYAP